MGRAAVGVGRSPASFVRSPQYPASLSPPHPLADASGPRPWPACQPWCPSCLHTPAPPPPGPTPPPPPGDSHTTRWPQLGAPTLLWIHFWIQTHTLPSLRLPRAWTQMAGAGVGAALPHTLTCAHTRPCACPFPQLWIPALPRALEWAAVGSREWGPVLQLHQLNEVGVRVVGRGYEGPQVTQVPPRCRHPVAAPAATSSRSQRPLSSPCPSSLPAAAPTAPGRCWRHLETCPRSLT